MGIKTLTHNDLKFYLGVIQLETDLVPFYAGLAFICSTFVRQFCSAQFGLVRLKIGKCYKKYCFSLSSRINTELCTETSNKS